MSLGKWDTIQADKATIKQLVNPAFYQLLTGTYTVAEDAPGTLLLDANGVARNVDMPAPSANIEGKVWTIVNPAAGAFALTVRNNGGATIVSVPQAKAAQIMVYNKAGVLTWVVVNTLA